MTPRAVCCNGHACIAWCAASAAIRPHASGTGQQIGLCKGWHGAIKSATSTRSQAYCTRSIDNSLRHYTLHDNFIRSALTHFVSIDSCTEQLGRGHQSQIWSVSNISIFTSSLTETNDIQSKPRRKLRRMQRSVLHMSVRIDARRFV